jgi:hypothetical protein
MTIRPRTNLTALQKKLIRRAYDPNGVMLTRDEIHLLLPVLSGDHKIARPCGRPKEIENKAERDRAMAMLF